MRFLGIDAGATYLKGAVLNTETLCVEQVIRSVFPPFLPSREGIREVSPGAILACVSQLLDELYSAAPDACGLFLCGQMHGLVLTSGRGGASSNFITWQDSRASASFAALASRVDPATRQETGNELRPSLPLSTLFFLRQTNQLPTGDFLPASLVDFLAASLCGTRPVTSASNAAAHGCMDVRRGRWHSGMLAAAGLQSIELPEIVADGACVGTLPRRWGSMPCYAPVGDQQAALLGTSLQPGELSLNVATGSQVSMVTRDPAAGDYQFRPYFGDQFLRTITHIPAGRSLNLLLGLLAGMDRGCGEDLWARLERAARDVPATTLHVDLSFFPCALGDSGSIANIREDNFTVGHLFRATIESMAANFEHCAARLSPERSWDRLVFSGGLILKLQTLQEAVIRRFGCRSRMAAEREDTLQGLTFLASQCAVPADLMVSSL
jgi:sugar (pentulose or hexulose) kinase